MDSADKAAEQQDEYLQLGIQKMHLKRLDPCGKCYNCGESQFTNRLFCDKDCQEDYEKRLNAKERLTRG